MCAQGTGFILGPKGRGKGEVFLPADLVQTIDNPAGGMHSTDHIVFRVVLTPAGGSAEVGCASYAVSGTFQLAGLPNTVAASPPHIPNTGSTVPRGYGGGGQVVAWKFTGPVYFGDGLGIANSQAAAKYSRSLDRVSSRCNIEGNTLILTLPQLTASTTYVFTPDPGMLMTAPTGGTAITIAPLTLTTEAMSSPTPAAPALTSRTYDAASEVLSITFDGGLVVGVGNITIDDYGDKIGDYAITPPTSVPSRGTLAWCSFPVTDAAVSISDNGRIIRVSGVYHECGLYPNTWYHVTMPAGAFKGQVANNPIAEIDDSTPARTIFFNTVPDNTAPTVVESYPANLATSINEDDTIYLWFNEDVFAYEGETAITITVTGGGFTGNCDINSSPTRGSDTTCHADLSGEDREISLWFEDDFEPLTTYTVTVTAGVVEDWAYNAMAADHTFSFTTGDNSLPTLDTWSGITTDSCGVALEFAGAASLTLSTESRSQGFFLVKTTRSTSLDSTGVSRIVATATPTISGVTATVVFSGTGGVGAPDLVAGESRMGAGG